MADTVSVFFAIDLSGVTQNSRFEIEWKIFENKWTQDIVAASEAPVVLVEYVRKKLKRKPCQFVRVAIPTRDVQKLKTLLNQTLASGWIAFYDADNGLEKP